MSFPGPVGTKRRRMRSTGAAVGKTAGDDSSVLDDDDEKVTQTSKCKGVTTIPIFLKSKWISIVRKGLFYNLVPCAGGILFFICGCLCHGCC